MYIFETLIDNDLCVVQTILHSHKRISLYGYHDDKYRSNHLQSMFGSG